MDDRDLERLLRRYRPTDPPPGFRERCLEQVTREDSRPIWPWAAAAAVLLTAVIGLTTATARLDPPVAAVPDWSAQAIDRLATLLGGGAAARRTAEIIVIEEQPEEIQ